MPAPRTDEVLRFACLNGAASRAVSTYSGGMIQRLGLAVAALPEAPVLLLDEPTAALDPEGLAAFYALAEERRREGKTILFTSHHLGDVERIADRFAVLVEGRLVALLSAAELAGRLADRGVLRLRLDRAPGDVLDALRPACPAASVAADELVLPGPASARPALLAAVGATGAVVLSLTADEGRLDALYSELVGARDEDRAPVLVSALSVVLLAACGDGTQGPAPLDTKNDACAWCRMSVSDLRFAAQLTAPGHEPKFFDDAGCLRDWLKAPREEAPWTAWVTDHRTKEWVKAKDATFTRNPTVQTPMNSGLVAHASRRLA